MISYEEKYNEWLEENEEIEQKLNLKKMKYDQVKKEYDIHQDNKPIEPKKDFY